MKYIIGSGLIGFLAKHIYPSYELLPVGKSRYYQFDVATCDNYILYDKTTDEVIRGVVNSSHLLPVMFTRAVSLNGQLSFGRQFLDIYINKAYNQRPHPATHVATWMDGFIYNVTGTDLFKKLEQPLLQTCRQWILSQEKLITIDSSEQVIHTTKRTLPYTHIINTCPLNYLYKLLNIDHTLECLDIHTYIVESDELDFEGASEVLIADSTIDFYKCTHLGNNKYQFYSHIEISDIRGYLSLMMNKFSVISGTCVKEATPIGDPEPYQLPDNIVCVGSNAQWDDNMDLSSSIKRLINLKLA